MSLAELSSIALERQNVNHIPVKVANRLNILSMIGPAAVTLTIFALVIKGSPFYIDLSATALVGVLLCWRMKSVGLYLASALLGTVLAYNFFLDGVPLTLWEAGLGASLELTFVMTALASLELTDAFGQACKSVSVNALSELEEWKAKIAETLAGKEAALSESENFKNKLLKLQDALKVKTEQSEMFERLLEMARKEITETAAFKENAEKQYLEQKNLALNFEATASDLNQFIKLQAEEIAETRTLLSRLENDLSSAHTELFSKNNLLQKQALQVMDLEWKLEQAAEPKALGNESLEKLAEVNRELELYKSMASDSAGKVEALGQQLGDLIDRLKNLQTENDKLQKELEAALNPEAEPAGDIKELNRVQGLYNQLRLQFTEKSQNLDETRKLLFHSQESVLALQKEIEEKYVYDQEQTLAAYEKHHVELSAQVKRLESEVAQLEDLLKLQTSPAPKAPPVKVQGPVKVQVLPKTQTQVKVQVSPKPKKQVQIKEKK